MNVPMFLWFCAAAGAMLYAFASGKASESSKASELGRIVFFCAFLAVMLRLAKVL